MKAFYWILAVVVALAVVGYLGHRTLVVLRTTEVDPNSYVSLLTLVVTLMAGVSGLLGIGSAWFSLRMRKSVEEAVAYSESFKRLLEDRVAQLDTCDSLTEAAYGTYRPTGRLLARKLRTYKPSAAFQMNLPDVADEISLAIRFLAREIEHNSLMSGQAIRLFSNSSEDVKSAAMALGAHSAEHGTDIIRRRLDLERAKQRPDPELVSFLAYVVGAFSN